MHRDRVLFCLGKSLNPQGIYNAAEVVKPFYMPVSEVFSEPKNSLPWALSNAPMGCAHVGNRPPSRDQAIVLPAAAVSRTQRAATPMAQPRRNRPDRAPSRRQLVIVLRRPWAFKPVRGKRRNLSLSSSFRRSTTSHPVAASTYACDSGGLTVVAPATTRCHLKLPMVQTKSTTNYLY